MKAETAHTVNRTKNPRSPGLILIFGGIAIGVPLFMRISAYWDGTSFEKSSPVVFGVALLLVGIVGYLVSAILTLFGILRGKIFKRWMVAIVAIPLCWFGSYEISIPNFTDGMAKGLREKVSAERLRNFADVALRSPHIDSPQPFQKDLTDHLVALLKRDYPDIYALSPIEPRVSASRGGIEIFWGNAIVKHWGIRIGSRPFQDVDAEYQKGVSYREAYDGIWVYHDRY